MKEYRSASQILFGFLPNQTVDLAGQIWKVKDWRHPVRQFIDPTAIRRELLKLSAPWQKTQRDGNFVQHLHQGREVAVYSLDRRNGVNVEPFPQVWTCRRCDRVYFSHRETCHCGGKSFGQLPFVGVHDCGQVKAPFINGCPEHKQLKIRLPGTAALSEILFSCPVCNKQLQKGLGFANCGCGKGKFDWNVHRASRVFTPRSLVVVNPVSSEDAKRMNEGGGPERALEWVLDGMKTRKFDESGVTRETFIRDLVAKGLSEALAASLANQAVLAGEVAEAGKSVDVPRSSRDVAAAEAATVAIALDQSRVRLEDLVAGAESDSHPERRRIYRDSYPMWLQRAGMEAVELVEKFPVLTGNFGYTRGDSEPGKSTLQPFRVGSNYAVYADINETEALFFRLDPMRVARWLTRRGFDVGSALDARGARVELLKRMVVPVPGEEVPSPTLGSTVLELVHSVAHRVIRRAAVFSGIDRNALAELLVPTHLGFFIYAAARGDFVLGGLQAVFETELDALLKDFCMSDHRCILDPGCSHAGGACMACLHLGEASCRYYNRFLTRDALWGPSGYLTEAVHETGTTAPARDTTSAQW